MKNKKMVSLLSNLSYTFFANILSLLVSAVTVLIIPRYVDVDTFGYYQLYLFYIGYVGFLYFGWNEGVYLRLGGKYYQDLDRPIHCTQFWLLGLLETITYSLIFLTSLVLIQDANKVYVIGCTCVVAVGMCLRWFILSILQAVSRIKENAFLTISEKFVFVVLMAALIISGYRGFELFVWADVFSKFVSLGFGVWFCRDIVFSKFMGLKKTVSEIKANMSVGINMMVASMCSLLISGIIRQGIEMRWGIATFGRVSLTLNISHMAVTAINAIAVVAYPILRRMDHEHWVSVYRVMQTVLMCIVFGVLLFYYPMKQLLTLWLPQYSESLRYAAILFPICAYESKVSILVNTYLNTLRLEKLLMRCNLAALALSVICTAISTIVLNSVTAAILSILIVLIFRCILSEVVLARKLPIHVTKNIALELIMTVAFIICNWYFGFAGMVAYAVCYIVYLIIKRQDIKETFNFIKSMG